MDDIKEEQHGLLGLHHRDRSGLYPLCKLVYGDKQVGIAPGRSFERSDQIEPPDHERPRDGDRLECLGRQVGLPSVVLTPFIGAYDLLGIGYCNGPVEALSECVSNQGPRRGGDRRSHRGCRSAEVFPVRWGCRAARSRCGSICRVRPLQERKTWRDGRVVELPSSPSAACHRGGSRGRVFSSHSEGQALSLDPLQDP